MDREQYNDEWKTAQGESIPIGNLTEGHLNNCLSFLERSARNRLKLIGKDEGEWQKVVDQSFWTLRAEAARRTAKLGIPSKKKTWWSRIFGS